MTWTYTAYIKRLKMFTYLYCCTESRNINSSSLPNVNDMCWWSWLLQKESSRWWDPPTMWQSERKEETLTHFKSVARGRIEIVSLSVCACVCTARMEAGRSVPNLRCWSSRPTDSSEWGQEVKSPGCKRRVHAMKVAAGLTMTRGRCCVILGCLIFSVPF